MREVFFAGKETQKRPSLQSYMITDCASEHWVVRFECVEHRLLRDRSGNVQSDFTANMGEVSKVCRQNDANHSLTIFAPPSYFVITDSAPSGNSEWSATQSSRRRRFCPGERTFIEHSPEFLDGFHRVCELGEVHRFDHISVGAKLIASLYVWPLA